MKRLIKIFSSVLNILKGWRIVGKLTGYKRRNAEEVRVYRPRKRWTDSVNETWKKNAWMWRKQGKW